MATYGIPAKALHEQWLGLTSGFLQQSGKASELASTFWLQAHLSGR